MWLSKKRLTQALSFTKVAGFVTITALLFTAWIGAANYVNSYRAEEKQHVKWCNSIFHQNVGCPLNGKVVIPKEVQAQQDADHLEWCDQIYHQNVGCPNYGNVKVPASAQALEDKHHLEWCDSNYHQNVGCPLYGQVEVPEEVQRKWDAQHLEWCDSIYHQNVSCPKHGYRSERIREVLHRAFPAFW